MNDLRIFCSGWYCCLAPLTQTRLLAASVFYVSEGKVVVGSERMASR